MNNQDVGDIRVKITKRQLRRIIKEEKQKLLREMYGDSSYRYGTSPSRGNQSPPEDSNWYVFAKEMDVGTLDLDDMAYDLGFKDFRDMDISISPRDLAKRDPNRFTRAARETSMYAQDLSDNQILGIADMPGMF